MNKWILHGWPIVLALFGFSCLVYYSVLPLVLGSVFMWHVTTITGTFAVDLNLLKTMLGIISFSLCAGTPFLFLLNQKNTNSEELINEDA